MKLYTYWRSSAAFRVRLALALKGIKVEHVAINLTQGDQRTAYYTEINHQSIVPTLEDGGLVIRQSVAIFEYLEETYPEPPLMPSDTAGRARVRAIAQAIACEMHPRLSSRVRSHVAEKFSDQARIEWYAYWALQGFSALENWLASDPNAGHFCHGDTMTMADCFLIPQLYAAKRYELDLSAFPTLLAVKAACAQHPAFLEALPENQPDAR
ncbi:MAG: maleylacetoacetate isomerase [Rhodospirillaceae bacterium]|nr:maleylacetoacetate isomerase [Rhodospirillaceae bacterium]|tara:strand:- start:3 stop:635 length:633 start_codon:yes stop_codon:yes gene_type:complete